MQKAKINVYPGCCPNCKGPIAEVTHTDYFTKRILEYHCNQCGLAWGPEGEIRQEGRKDLYRPRKEIVY